MLLEVSNMKLQPEERILFMKAAKSRFNYYRNGWKNLMDQQSENETYIPREIIESHILILENEIKDFCREIDEYLNRFLENSNPEDYEEIIFFKKLKADYFRYYSEVSDENEFTIYVELCQDLYKEAYEKCQEKLDPFNTLTLSVALNYSIFAYFILDDTKKAFDIADKATKAADKKKNMDQEDKEYKLLYKSLEENLTIWKIELFDVN